MAEASLTDEEQEKLIGLVEEFIQAPRGREGWEAWAELTGYIAWLKRRKTRVQFPIRGRKGRVKRR